jgi:NAD(P)-dependent dehydrogenase (short-subunit alcohol dehydrogenase family)
VVSAPHSGKRAVVTGGAGGIGSAVAARLAADGAQVVVVDLRAPNSAEGHIGSELHHCEYVECDVSSESQVAAFCASFLAQHERCDILVNNAGVFATRRFEDMTFAEWRRTFSINIDAMFLMTRALLPAMRRNGWGRVVNLASNTLGSAVPNHVDYIASKGGVVGFTRGLASEVGVEGVTVNAIAPGLTRTPGTQASEFRARGVTLDQALEFVVARQAIKRPGQAADIGGVASFLASDDAGFITGQTIYVDGGLVRV